jgi:hypothetical protein
MRLTRKISLAYFALLFSFKEAQQNQSPAPMMIVQAAQFTPGCLHPRKTASLRRDHGTPASEMQIEEIAVHSRRYCSNWTSCKDADS